MICCKEASAETKAFRAGSFTSHWIKLLPPLLFCVRHIMLSRFISVALRLLVAHSDQKRKEVLSGSEWFPNNCQSFKIWFGCASWHTEAQHMHLVYRAVVLLFILIKIPTNCIIFTLCGLLVNLSLIFYWLCKVVSTNNAHTAVCVCGASGWEMLAWHCHITITITMINDCGQQNVWSFFSSTATQEGY